MKKPVKIIMLPTESNLDYPFIAQNMEMGSNNELLLVTCNSNNSLDYVPQHLYVTVPQDVEPIKENDWFTDEYKIYHNKLQLDGYIGFKKIIATTDPNLTSECKTCNNTKLLSLNDNGILDCYDCKTVPQFQPQFLKEYVSNPSGNWEIEYQYKTVTKGTNEFDFYEEDVKTLKVNSDNTVTITAKRKTYTKEEVIDLIYTHTFEFDGKNRTVKELEDWIKENL